MTVTILEKQIVVWWDPNASRDDAIKQGLGNIFTTSGNKQDKNFETLKGCWRAYKDECPHRLVPLSEGRVNEVGDLECPYHGWSFTGENGSCTKIP